MMNQPKIHNEFFVKCSNKKYGSQVIEFAIDCKNCGSNFSSCVYSGQSIMMKGYYKCKRCKHKYLESEIFNINQLNFVHCVI